jgi:hypothetical protein
LARLGYPKIRNISDPIAPCEARSGVQFPSFRPLQLGTFSPFDIPGMTFLLDVGKEVPHACTERCILRSSFHPIFISADGDRRVQTEIMAMVGKVAPAWAKYPLTEGVENS